MTADPTRHNSQSPPETSEPRRFSGRHLTQIAFPLGGIGTGTVSLGGRGDLRDWEIFNRPAKGKRLPYTFFSLWCRSEGAAPVARVLERRFLPDYSGGSGIPTLMAPGLPRLAEATFTGTYPLARIDFQDDQVPLTLSLRAWNPFIPMNAEDSGLPVALFEWTLGNPGPRRVEATLALSLLNAVGHDGQIQPGNRFHSLFGSNLNRFHREGGLAELRMSSGKYPEDHPQFGTMAVLTPSEQVTYSAHWERAGWWDDLQSFWDDFSEDGRLPEQQEFTPSPDGQTDVGTLGSLVVLEPGEETVVRFLLAWHFPNLTNTWNAEEAVRGRRLGNYYATRFGTAWEAAEYAAANLPRLAEETERFHDTLFESTLPAPALDAVSSQMSILRTTTCLRTADGRFNAFEGCSDNAGCCPMNCTHVWNYEQAVAHLFPELERTMRETDFGVNTRPSGDMAFRTLLPLSTDHLWGFAPAADGQMGSIVRLYREWKLSGDTAWMLSLWPRAQAALEFAWSDRNRHRWDADRDGVMEGIQHNTYDIEFHGPNTMMGSWYLAALRAAAEMAEAADQPEKAREYRELAERGAQGHDALFNGEYYEQKVVPGDPDAATAINEGKPFDGVEPRYQYGPGCLSDQLLGQWAAHCVGLGYVLPQGRVRSALQAVYHHNFLADFSRHENCQRVYALNDEAGLLLCTWPRGGRPKYPFPYADEVWTGIEYHVAAHLIYEDLVEEGLSIVKAVRDRYDGEKRNPWDEVECGHHYARALASWSLLLALSGFRWDGAAGHLAFAPKVRAQGFRCFFAAGTAWGLFTQRQGDTYEATLEPRWGELTLRRLSLPLPAGELTVTLDGRPLQARLIDEGTVELADSLALRAGQTLRVAAAP